MNEAIIEKVKATFLDDVFIIPQDEIIHRIDYRESRYYVKTTETGEHIVRPSVTSIIKQYHPMSPYLLKWWCDLGYEKAKEVLAETSIYGTLCHTLWAKLLLRYNLDMSEIGLYQEIMTCFERENKPFIYDRDQWISNLKQDIIGFIQWVQDYQIKPIAIELTLHGKDDSGTLDLVCQATLKGIGQKIILCDWKSGRKDFYDDNVIQLEGYRELWNEKFPDKKIDHMFNYGCKDFRLPIGKTVIPYRFTEQSLNPMYKRWPFYLGMYLIENPEIKIESRTEIKDIIVNIESQVKDCFTEIDPLEFLKENENAGNNPE